MKIIKNVKIVLIAVAMLGVFTVTSCKKPDIRNTALATEAMERAKTAEAPKCAPKEYRIASRLYDKMNTELANEQLEEANKTALLVIDAANESINVCRRKKENNSVTVKSEK
ncbi:MAG: hypothetical protein ACRCTJ_04885 [Brevinema sp.]